MSSAQPGREKVPSLNVLLTSAGPTTKAIQEDLAGKALRARGPSRKLEVLRIADGWQPFKKVDVVSPLERRVEGLMSRAARFWSSKYLEYVFGKHVEIETLAIGGCSESL